MSCYDCNVSERFRRAAAAGQGLPAIEPGMPLPAGTGMTRRDFVSRSAGLALAVYGGSALSSLALDDGIAKAAANAPADQKVLVSIFGCLSSCIIGASRLGFVISQDAPAFRSLARIHPRYHTPTAGIVILAVWSAVLALSGSYEQLFQYALFASFIFHAITGLALFSLRRTQPHMPRPYRVAGYPWMPALFVLAMTALVLNTLRERPVQSLLGVGLVMLGLPFFRPRRPARAAGGSE